MCSSDLLFGLGSIENIKGKVKYLVSVGLLVVLNVFFSIYSFQLDLTKEKRYTLSKSSEAIIASIHKPVKVHLYLGGDIPTYYKTIAIATQQLLDRYKQINPKNISWTWEVPSAMYTKEALYQFYDSLK